MKTTEIKLFNSLAEYWPLLSPPDDYLEEATLLKNILLSQGEHINSVLELGSGGGHNAFHLKKYFNMTLVEMSGNMLDMSIKLNAECEHHIGDMRYIRLNKQFDAVFIHDAIVHIQSVSELKKVFETADTHCKKGGYLMIVPDYFKENFKPNMKCGGIDVNRKGIRFISWITDNNPNDDLLEHNFIYTLKNDKGEIRMERDLFNEGIFSSELWQKLFRQYRFEPKIVALDHSEMDPGSYNCIIGKKLY
jgi:SAM-dependent methyltransferase